MSNKISIRFFNDRNCGRLELTTSCSQLKSFIRNYNLGNGRTYSNNQLVAITRELTDMLRRSKTVDWQRRSGARAKMRMMVKRLLKRYKYPPDGQEEALKTVMSQCEMWTDNTDLSAAANEEE